MLFGDVVVNDPLADPDIRVAMTEFHGLDDDLNRLFAQTFVFRPWMKWTCSLACLLIAGVLVCFALRALFSVAVNTKD
jgi:hypothetical protein